MQRYTELPSMAIHEARPIVPKATGLGNNYYKFPDEAKEIQDLIEHKNMPFSIANIFKACYRFGEKPNVTKKYDLEKIIWFANRELNLLKGI